MVSSGTLQCNTEHRTGPCCVFQNRAAALQQYCVGWGVISWRSALCGVCCLVCRPTGRSSGRWSVFFRDASIQHPYARIHPPARPRAHLCRRPPSALDLTRDTGRIFKTVVSLHGACRCLAGFTTSCFPTRPHGLISYTLRRININDTGRVIIYGRMFSLS